MPRSPRRLGADIPEGARAEPRLGGSPKGASAEAAPCDRLRGTSADLWAVPGRSFSFGVEFHGAEADLLIKTTHEKAGGTCHGVKVGHAR